MKKLLFPILALVLALGLALPVVANPDPGLAGLWRFDGNANDSSGNANNGTVSGAETYVDPSPMGKALTFDGTSTYVTVGHADSLDMTSAYTIEAWVKVTDVTTYRPIAFRGATNANDIEVYVQHTTNDLIVAHNRGNGGTWDYVGFADPPTGSWFHLAVTFDGTNVKAYYGGTLQIVTQQTIAMAAPSDTDKGWWIGKVDHTSFGGTRLFKGDIDEVRIWDEALSVSQLDDMTPPTVSLTSTASDPTNTSPIPMTATFSENVTGFVAGDITVGNGVASNLLGGPAVYTFDVTPSDHAVTVDIAADVATDAALNGNTAAPQFSITYNRAPVADNDAYSTDEDTTLSVVAATGVLNGDTDADGDALTAIKVTDPAKGILTLNSDGSFSYNPNGEFEGLQVGEPEDVTFTYKANDGSLDSNTATVTVTINGVNDAPVAVNDTYSVAENAALTVAATGVLGNDTDVEDDPLTAVWVSDPSNGTLTLNSNGSFTYTPNPNWWGIDSFTYTAYDGDLNSNVATVTIKVIPRSVVTNSSLCTFDFDDTIEGDQFRLIFTPNNDPPNTFKLSASNPGQFFYNLYYPEGGEVGVTIPYPFVTQGAVPIHFYSDVDMNSNNGEFCFTLGELEGSDSQQVAIGDHGVEGVATLPITIPEGASFVTIHLDYGLKGTSPYTAGGAYFKDAIGSSNPTSNIPNLTPYGFSAADGVTPDTAEIQNENAFKKTPGIGGLVMDGTDPEPSAEVNISCASLSISEDVQADEDGWYMWNYKHKGKAAEFTVTYNDSPKTVTLKANSLQIVNFP